MKEEFEMMPFDQKVSYLVENLSELPDDLEEAGVEILAPECAIPLTTPNRNLKAIVEAAKEIQIGR